MRNSQVGFGRSSSRPSLYSRLMVIIALSVCLLMAYVYIGRPRSHNSQTHRVSATFNGQNSKGMDLWCYVNKMLIVKFMPIVFLPSQDLASLHVDIAITLAGHGPVDLMSASRRELVTSSISSANHALSATKGQSDMSETKEHTSTGQSDMSETKKHASTVAVASAPVSSPPPPVELGSGIASTVAHVQHATSLLKEASKSLENINAKANADASKAASTTASTAASTASRQPRTKEAQSASALCPSPIARVPEAPKLWPRPEDPRAEARGPRAGPVLPHRRSPESRVQARGEALRLRAEALVPSPERVP
eukprot:gene23047-30241_t